MQVFLVGGSGGLGAALLPLLIEHGHNVLGLTRSSEGAALFSRFGAEIVTGDVFDAAALRAACAVADAVIDLSAVEPRLPRPGGRDWSVNDRIRSQGARNLVEAALGGNIQRYVHCTPGLVYGDHGTEWVDETAELLTAAALEAAAEGEEAVLTARTEHGLPATVLRCGYLYGPRIAATEQLVERVKSRLLPLSGNSEAFTSFLHVEDTAIGVLLALEASGAPPEVLNLCDDVPAPVGEWLPWLAQELGAGVPVKIPRWLGGLVGGSEEEAPGKVSLRMSNRRAREVLGFRPRYGSYREGFKAVLR